MGKGSFYDTLIGGDWMGRSAEDYTYEKKGHAIGWEDTLTSGDAYSSFILRVDSKAKHIEYPKQILLAKQACTNIMNRMLVGSEWKPIITFAQDVFTNYAKQDKKLICVSLEPLKKDNAIKFPSFNHALDPILGGCVHEMGHILYTDDEYANYIMKFKGVEAELKHRIMNILEDERIEKLIAENYRGYTHYIGKIKDYCFGKKFQEELAQYLNQHSGEEQHPVNKLMETFLHLVRYPKALQEVLVNEFESEIVEFQEILNPYPENSRELSEATEKIYAVILRYFEDTKKPEPEQGEGDQQEENGDPQDSQNQQQSKAKAQSGGGNTKSDKGEQGDNTQEEQSQGDESEDSDNGQGDQEKKEKQSGKGKSEDGEEQEDQDDSQEGNGEDGEDTDEKGKPEKGGKSDQESDEDSDEDGDDSGKSNSSGNETEEENAQPEDSDNTQETGGKTPEEIIEEMMEQLAGFLQAVADANPQMGTAEEIAQAIFGGEYGVEEALTDISDFDNPEMEARKSGTHVYPQLRNLHTNELNVRFLEAKDNISTQNHYDKALNAVRSSASSLRATLQELNRNTEITNTGLFEGNFDDGLLVDAIIGAKNVYNETHRIQNRGASIGLLIDESYSMNNNNAWFLAQQIAVMFERALEGVNKIDFFCYGHTTGNDDKAGLDDATLINCYFEGRKKGNRKDLGKIYRHNTNRDGHAILEVVSRMRTMAEKDSPIVLFMISDGEPSASVPHGFDQKSYTKKAVDTVEKTMNATVIHIAIERGIPSKDMFNHYVAFTDFRTLVRDVGNLLKRIVIDKQAPITI